jgi:hypothetical protein
VEAGVEGQGTVAGRGGGRKCMLLFTRAFGRLLPGRALGFGQ